MIAAIYARKRTDQAGGGGEHAMKMHDYRGWRVDRPAGTAGLEGQEGKMKPTRRGSLYHQKYPPDSQLAGLGEGKD
jgi:hypothetical protein